MSDKNKDVNKDNDMYTKPERIESILLFIFMFLILRISNVTK